MDDVYTSSERLANDWSQTVARGGQARPAQRAKNWLNVAPGVLGLQLPIANVYFVGPTGGATGSWVLVDAGLPFSTQRIVRAAADRFGARVRPAAIVLTHGHFDHVGTLPQLAEFWDVPVYAHPLEMPYLTGRSSYPPPDPSVGGGAMSFLSRIYPRGPINLGSRVQPLPADGSVPHLPGWRWLHTPGHTAGHVSFFRDSDRSLLAGDAFVTTKQESALGALLQPCPRVRRPPAYYTSDWHLALQSITKLAQLRPLVAATGHGLPMRGDPLQRQLDDLVRRWNEVALPPRGRYVREPAVADERGVVHVPPAVADPQLMAIAAVGLAALVGIGLWRATTRSHARKRPMPLEETDPCE